MDDSDTYGVEMALQLAAVEGDEVTLVSMAPGGETSGLRTGLAMGAAKAILVSDPALGAPTPSARPRCWRQRSGPTRTSSSRPPSRPTGTGTLPVQVAELMGLPSVTFAKAISIDGSTVKVERQTEAGYDEVVCPMPAVVTVTAGVVEPRYPSFKGIMAAKSKPVQTPTVADLGTRRLPGGLGGRPRGDRRRLGRPSRVGAGEIVVDEGDGGERVVAFLEQLKVV